ncbi:cytochrome c oxidase assembly protein (plasmid) [Deinococcus metallilatus]|uniref:Membrane protein n=2 Tax=Deinococcus metallilatus TaxID=1211322 RepID=A0ABR6MYA9_9DEIO|nr:putative membrane protein [Deinococcus metallilatus]QBY07088.1 cytochrome c oxidase assembly protein [Deinococcus metallilatus]GMA15171.1 cytochrome c oxidase assembly protein [Deinococcus metallilatus]
MHAGHGMGTPSGPGADLPLLLPWGLLLAAAMLYGGLATRQVRAGRGWPAARSIWFALGSLLLAVAFSPALTELAHADVRAHMAQHLLTGMFAPLALALAWPLTLLLRNLPVQLARRLMGWLHAPPLRLLTSPVTALLLNVGGLSLLYLTPLYALMLHRPLVHGLVQFHVFAAGLLYTVVVAGIEPVVARAPFALRVAVLLLGTAAHATLAKLLYAGWWPHGTGNPPGQLQQAAKLMYSWGDLAEMLLAVLVFWGWYVRRGRAQARARGSAGQNRAVTSPGR